MSNINQSFTREDYGEGEARARVRILRPCRLFERTEEGDRIRDFEAGEVALVLVQDALKRQPYGMLKGMMLANPPYLELVSDKVPLGKPKPKPTPAQESPKGRGGGGDTDGDGEGGDTDTGGKGKGK